MCLLSIGFTARLIHIDFGLNKSEMEIQCFDLCLKDDLASHVVTPL